MIGNLYPAAGTATVAIASVAACVAVAILVAAVRITM